MSNTSKNYAMISRTERSRKLRPRDPWDGATFEGARLMQLREAQFVSLSDKLRWLEQAASWAEASPEGRGPAGEAQATGEANARNRPSS